MPHPLLHSRSVAAISIAFMTFGLIVVIRQVGLLQGLELGLYDVHLKLKPQSQPAQFPVILLSIDETDIQRFGYPVTDTNLAIALEKLIALEPGAIGIDFFRDLETVGREKLVRIAQNHPSIVFIEKILEKQVAAPDFIQEPTQLGFADLKQDDNGVIRRGLLMLWDENNNIRMSFSLQLVMAYLKPQGIILKADADNPEQIKLGETILTRFQTNDGGYINADEGGYQYLLNYDLNRDQIPRFSFSQLIDDNIPKEKIKNTLIIIGLTAVSVRDLHETPFSSGWGRTTPSYGVEIHAQMADQLLRGISVDHPPVSVPSLSVEYLMVLITAIFAAILAVYYEQRITRMALSLLITTALLLFTAQLLFNHGLWLSIVPAILGLVTTMGFTTAYLAQRERRSMGQMMNMFGKFVSPEVAALLWEQRENIIENGKPKSQRLMATVMITDLQGFVSATQNMDPADLMNWLNRYLDVMTKTAINHGGIVDDYAGDGIKINFGVPLASTEQEDINKDASAAVNCALDMGEQVKAINIESRDNGMPEYGLRVGINTGTVIAGSLGSSERMKYTTVGDVVNTAARLESFQKDQACNNDANTTRILISQETRDRLNDSFDIESLGNYLMPGKTQEAPIFCVTRKISLYITNPGGSHA